METTPLTDFHCERKNTRIYTDPGDVYSTVSSVKDTEGHRSDNDISSDKGARSTEPNEENETEVQNKFAFSSLTHRGKYVLVLCSLATFCSSVSFSSLAPFYPHEADKKGMSTTTMGFVFSVFELVNVITAPLFGKYMTRIGIKFVYLSGLFMSGTSSIVFGNLVWCPPGVSFVVLSLVCRSMIALGFSAFNVASFAIISNEFPSNVATVFSVMETVHGVGLMVGPVIGSGLYQLGGFSAPFTVLGSVVLLIDVAIYLFLPSPKEGARQEKQTMLRLLQSPVIVISMFNIGVTALGIGVFEATLAKHLEAQGLAVSTIGFFFVVGPLTFGLFTPLWGYLTDKKDVQGPLVVTGLFLNCVGYMCLGPTPWIDFLPRVPWMTAIGLLLVGLGIGPVYVSGVKCMVLGAFELGFTDNLDTYGLVSGVFYFSFCAGAFLGPTLGGFLAEEIGFSTTYSALAMVFLANAAASLIFFTQRYNRRKNHTINKDSSTIDNGHTNACPLTDSLDSNTEKHHVGEGHLYSITEEKPT